VMETSQCMLVVKWVNFTWNFIALVKVELS